MGTDSALFARPAAPWMAPRGLESVIDRWRGDPSIWRNVSLHETVPAREARDAELPSEIHPLVRAALARRGIERAYAHQTDAILRALRGEHVVVATPTASGKSLCYHVPVLDRLAREADARALYLFPTKALARDQEASLRELLREVGLTHGAITYDGDTPGDARRAARERSGILLTNPDMLHAGVLPHHASWARFFSQLRFVVIDELHTYRGVFGSHLANVLRRLRRIARFHGSDPSFVFASATIGNPREHASRMIGGRPAGQGSVSESVGSEVALIDQSGAPAGPRHVVIYNPPLLNAELGVRASYLKTAVSLTADLLRAEVPTIVFGQSRNTVEVMLKYLRERLAADHLDPDAIQGYRSGYLPETRRRIEQGLRAGSIRGVVATNALELGIDIGSLQAVVCAGYPGSIAALWQRFGRAGRRTEPSLALMVASSQPLDQYVAREARLVIGSPVEHARIDPDNVEILVQHLKCASFELPFEHGEPFGDVPAQATADALEYLAQNRVLHAASGPGGKTTYHWASDAYPATHVSLRSVGWDNFVVVDLDGDRTIAEMDWRATHTMLHVQAIYQHDAEQYQVERLDFENHKAYVRKVEPDYYTTALTYSRVAITHEDDASHVALDPGTPGIACGVGEVSVIEKVVGYKKIKFHTHENVGYGDVRLPEMQMHTSGVWLTFSEETIRSLPHPRAIVLDAIRGIASAMHLVASIGLMCDPRDLGHALGDRSEGDRPARTSSGGPGFDPTIFLYDHVPNGVGLAPRIFEDREALLRRTRAAIEGCACEGGCPACIGASIGAPAPVPDLGARGELPSGASGASARSAPERSRGAARALDRPRASRATAQRASDLKELALELMDAIGVRAAH